MPNANADGATGRVVFAASGKLDEAKVGQAVKTATLDLLREGVRTKDLGGNESTDSFTAAVAACERGNISHQLENRALSRSTTTTSSRS